MLHQIQTEQLGPRGEAMADAIGKCVHCGFCLPACPTYQELETETDSPRGRILLMKSVLENELDAEQAQPHIDRCLGCLACVTHCPSGVPYDNLISAYRDHARNAMPAPPKRKSPLRDWLVSITLPYPTRFRLALALAKWTKPLAWMAPSALRPMLNLVPESVPPAEKLPVHTAPAGKKRGKVAILAGCGQQVLAPDINASAIRVLSRLGMEVVVPGDQGCCGALDWHTGRGDAASRFATKLMSSIPSDIDHFVTTAAGCGSAIHEYPLLLAGTEHEQRAKEFATRSIDISVMLSQLDIESLPALVEPVKIAYHDACHLAHAQGVRSEPRSVLRQIGGVELVDLADSDTCCGSAGTYNIEQPEIANSLGNRKAKRIIESGASVVVTGNIGCLVQIEKQLQSMGSQVRVLHTVQILDRAFREVPV